MSIVATEVVTEFGAQYIKGSQSQKDIYQQIYRPAETAAGFTEQPTQDTILRKSSSAMTRILQPFQKAFTPIGTLTFKPVSIPLFKVKVDISEYPDDLEATWLGFLAGEGIDRKAWPFWKWFIMKHVLPQAERDREVNEIFDGVYDAPTPGTAGDAGSAMDGINTVRKTLIDAGRISPIVTGAFPTDAVDFCTFIEEFVADFDKDVRKQVMELEMNEDGALLYKQGKRQKYNINYAQADNLMNVEDFPNVTIVGRQSFGSSEVLIATPKWNKLRPIKRTAVDKMFTLESVDRQVKFFADWWEGYGYALPEWVQTNDVDTEL